MICRRLGLSIRQSAKRDRAELVVVPCLLDAYAGVTHGSAVGLAMVLAAPVLDRRRTSARDATPS